MKIETLRFSLTPGGEAIIKIKKKKDLDMMVHACDPSYTGGIGRRSQPMLAQAKSMGVYLKSN
jgi:hypothetical protein